MTRHAQRSERAGGGKHFAPRSASPHRADCAPTSLKPLNAAHAAAIAKANGAPRGLRKLRGRELVIFLRDQMRRDLGLKPIKSRRRAA